MASLKRKTLKLQVSLTNSMHEKYFERYLEKFLS